MLTQLADQGAVPLATVVQPSLIQVGRNETRGAPSAKPPGWWVLVVVLYGTLAVGWWDPVHPVVLLLLIQASFGACCWAS